MIVCRGLRFKTAPPPVCEAAALTIREARRQWGDSALTSPCDDALPGRQHQWQDQSTRCTQAPLVLVASRAASAGSSPRSASPSRSDRRGGRGDRRGGRHRVEKTRPGRSRLVDLLGIAATGTWSERRPAWWVDGMPRCRSTRVAARVARHDPLSLGRVCCAARCVRDAAPRESFLLAVDTRARWSWPAVVAAGAGMSRCRRRPARPLRPAGTRV
jgi:hypothetical protein